ncbi:uncharacterized protein BCR38DRAFT_416855 [Pseudomassariella vexata]|uniref:Uncharacterized protein n=1 Tax=Pseudomassariella vexata TaxID=1141098 RepID=A0A1Y2EJ13_9PEZI|nr:uncharacterized protein BCR38DRAFT_416855 [Pseudomassariella vexata]ORY71447.1 hypothetical protein BCR38DRAFT_416855 [Pseudomassariella vexata]
MIGSLMWLGVALLASIMNFIYAESDDGIWARRTIMVSTWSVMEPTMGLLACLSVLRLLSDGASDYRGPRCRER